LLDESTGAGSGTLAFLLGPNNYCSRSWAGSGYALEYSARLVGEKVFGVRPTFGHRLFRDHALCAGVTILGSGLSAAPGFTL